MIVRRLLSVSTLLLLAACAAEPYVHHANEFDRRSPDFKAEPKDISTVSVCYSGRKADADATRRLAEQECARFGKTAQIEKQAFSDCPLSAPVKATFQCLGGSPYAVRANPGDGSTIGRGAPYGAIDWSLPAWFYGSSRGRDGR